MLSRRGARQLALPITILVTEAALLTARATAVPVTGIGWTPDEMMQSWTIEKRYFHAGFFPDVCAGEWTHCAHYTQMIWPTTDIGCGYAEGGGYGWLDCRYSPGGNKDGKPVGIANPLPERG